MYLFLFTFFFITCQQTVPTLFLSPMITDKWRSHKEIRITLVLRSRQQYSLMIHSNLVEYSLRRNSTYNYSNLFTKWKLPHERAKINISKSIIFVLLTCFYINVSQSDTDVIVSVVMVYERGSFFFFLFFLFICIQYVIY